jgi:hypothetical protein
MKKIDWMMLGNIAMAGSTLATASEPLPPLEPPMARQVHYLLDNPNLTEAEFLSLGHQWADSTGSVVLAILEGSPTSTLPWPFEGDLPSSTTVLRCARTWMDGTSDFQFVVPSQSIPESWGDDFTLGLEIDGTSHLIGTDSIFVVPAPPQGITLLQIGLSASLSDGSVRSGSLVLEVRSACPIPSPDLPPWPMTAPDLPWWVGTFHGSEAITGSAFVKLGADGTFDAPVILCDGFDPDLHNHVVSLGHGDQTWETLWDCNLSYRAVLESMLSSGLDVVFVDWSDGTRDVEENAALLQHVISLCNAYKAGNTPCAVVGMSMGGVISQIALRQMELQGESHCTGLFVACDSPLRGAYLPWSMLQAIDFFSVLSSEASALQQALQSPAAQQLLYIRPGGTPLPHLQMVFNLETWGLPEDCTNATIVNSHPNASFPLSPGPLLHASESLWGWEWAHVQLQPLPGDPYHSESTASSNVSFDASLPNTDTPWNDLFIDALGHCPSDFPNIESLPGSKTSHLDAFRSALEAGGLSVPVCQTETMFIPSFSALGLAPGSVSNSPFDWVHTENQFVGSTTHCDLTHHGEILLAWLQANAASGATTLGYDTPYSMNLPDGLLDSVIVGGMAGSGQTGWGLPAFPAQLSICSSQTSIGSKLTLGDEAGNFPGQLEVKSGQTLQLNPNSTLTIGAGSTLAIRNGGRLILDAHVHADIGGHLIIEPDAIIETHDGTAIQLEGNEGEWLHMGRWVVPGSAAVSLQGGAAHLNTGDGTQPRIELGPQSQLNGTGTAGYSTPQMLLKVGLGSALTLTGPGIVAWENVRLHLATASSFIAEDCRLRFESCRLTGEESEVSERPLLESNHRIRLLESSLEDIDVEWNLEGPGALWVWESTFENARIHCMQGGGTVEGCTLGGTEWLWENAIAPVTIRGSEFNGGFSSGSPMLKIVGGNAGTRLVENEWHSHRDGIWFIDSHQAWMKCNRLTGMELALFAKGTQLILNGPSGGNNLFESNDVHLRFQSSAPPHLSGGTNEFGAYSMALAMGDLLMPLGPGEAAQPLNASFHVWGNGSPELEVIGLTSSHPSAAGLPIHLTDPSPELAMNCETSPPPGEDAQVKSATPCPPGTTAMGQLHNESRGKKEIQEQLRKLNLWGQPTPHSITGPQLMERLFIQNGMQCRSVTKQISMRE